MEEHSDTFNTVKRVLAEGGVKGRMAFRRLFPAESQWRFKTKLPEAKPSAEQPKKVKEETEQLNELSKGTLKSYLNKAYPSLHDLEHNRNYSLHKKLNRLEKNRRVGIKQAWMKGSTLKEDKEYVRENNMNTDRRFTGGYEIPHHDHTEYKAWGQVTHHSDAEAKQDRDKKAKEWKAKGFKVTKHRTTGQIFDPDGPYTSSGTVYTARKHH